MSLWPPRRRIRRNWSFRSRAHVQQRDQAARRIARPHANLKQPVPRSQAIRLVEQGIAVRARDRGPLACEAARSEGARVAGAPRPSLSRSRRRSSPFLTGWLGGGMTHPLFIGILSLGPVRGTDLVVVDRGSQWKCDPRPLPSCATGDGGPRLARWLSIDDSGLIAIRFRAGGPAGLSCSGEDA